MPVLIQGGASGGGGADDGTVALDFIPTFATGGVLRGQGYIGGGNFDGGAQTAALTNRAFYTPFQYLYHDSAIEKIAFNITTAQATALGKVAIYPVSSNGAPGTRLWVSGNIDFSTTGVKEVVVTGVNLVHGQWIYCGIYTDITGVVLSAHTGSSAVTPIGIWDDGRPGFMWLTPADFASALPVSPSPPFAIDPGNWRFFFALKPTPV